MFTKPKEEYKKVYKTEYNLIKGTSDGGFKPIHTTRSIVAFSFMDALSKLLRIPGVRAENILSIAFLTTAIELEEAQDGN